MRGKSNSTFFFEGLLIGALKKSILATRPGEKEILIEINGTMTVMGDNFRSNLSSRSDLLCVVRPDEIRGGLFGILQDPWVCDYRCGCGQ